MTGCVTLRNQKTKKNNYGEGGNGQSLWALIWEDLFSFLQDGIDDWNDESGKASEHDLIIIYV